MQSGARVCMVASISSYTGGGYVARGAYATSKGAVLTMMKSCARELGPRGIAVNAVAATVAFVSEAEWIASDVEPTQPDEEP